MNTPAHLVVAAALFCRPTRPHAHPARQARVNAAALAGALIPDLSLFLMVLWESRVNLRTPDQIFGYDYRDPFWQAWFAVDNSIPLWAAVTLAGLALRAPAVLALGAAALVHVLSDLPLHHNDARPHFQPFTDWVFVSPVSYWDPARHGWLVGPLEALLVAGLCLLLWRRFRSRLVHALLAAAMLAEIAPALVFPLILG
ncbi:MAG: cobalamin biosynthesis protein CobQ [Paracoccaceae bacterium]